MTNNSTTAICLSADNLVQSDALNAGIPAASHKVTAPSSAGSRETSILPPTHSGKETIPPSADFRKVTILPSTLSPHTSVSPDANPQQAASILRVVAYCRVSTEEDNQHNSYTSQIKYYTDYIRSQPGWSIVGIFAEEGLSGTSTKNRKQFNRLLRKCRRHEIDIVLCKSISRFARNTVDCLELIRELKTLGIAVIFEKENLNTLSIPSEFLISLYASFAQAESESINRNITWEIEKKFRRGEFPYHFKWMISYRLEPTGTVQIEVSEAAIVHEIYMHFADGMSMGAIANLLTSRGIPRRCGSAVWERKNVKKSSVTKSTQDLRFYRKPIQPIV